MQILDFLVATNGIAQLWGANGQFLGMLSSNQYDANSISNLHGMYGGQYGLYSISNPHGMYGGQHGLYSPYNSYCLNPPIIFYQGQPMLIVTRNFYLQTNGLPIIDPDLVLGTYVQLDALSRVQQTNAEAITEAMTKAMQIAAGMFVR